MLLTSLLSNLGRCLTSFGDSDLTCVCEPCRPIYDDLRTTPIFVTILCVKGLCVAEEQSRQGQIFIRSTSVDPLPSCCVSWVISHDLNGLNFRNIAVQFSFIYYICFKCPANVSNCLCSRKSGCFWLTFTLFPSTTTMVLKTEMKLQSNIGIFTLLLSNTTASKSQ